MIHESKLWVHGRMWSGLAAGVALGFAAPAQADDRNSASMAAVATTSAVSTNAVTATRAGTPARVDLVANSYPMDDVLEDEDGFIDDDAIGEVASASPIRIERPQGRLIVGADQVQGRAIYGPRRDAKGGTFTGGIPSGMPLAAARLTSTFGYRLHPILGGSRLHAGVDLAAPNGTPVMATADGVVTSAGWRGGYGILIAVGHGGGMQTRYAHLSAIAVRPGTAVKAGQVIGYVGSTGNSTGPHLHYELRMNGRAVNPL